MAMPLVAKMVTNGLGLGVVALGIWADIVTISEHVSVILESVNEISAIVVLLSGLAMLPG